MTCPKIDIYERAMYFINIPEEAAA